MQRHRLTGDSMGGQPKDRWPYMPGQVVAVPVLPAEVAAGWGITQ